jgi:hypothetical protein
MLRVPETFAALAMRFQRKRADEVKAAFTEGILIGTSMISPGEQLTEVEGWRRSAKGIESAWRRSIALQNLAVPIEGTEVEAVPTIAKSEPRLQRHQTLVGDAAARVIGQGAEPEA